MRTHRSLPTLFGRHSAILRQSLLGQGTLERLIASVSGDAYFGTVVEEAPLLAARVAGLKRQHAAMLAMLDVPGEAPNDRERLWELEAPLVGLAAMLQAHERAESLLMRHFLLGSEGGAR